ncbi:hypothetical protein [Flavobacterium piscisymbiosum]|uniref:PH (Pleckstrin Homology) domain-containing protein n=1 Tax=Flavobacterium piscisymbiosum TaxID=2893753 RepID=A0ABS8MK18_9FLAO|nr:hypothetical protein [Flavobacterium sp. F-30]MCC9065829.1 hypothetical protein [Flavobacterium sp. F-30]
MELSNKEIKTYKSSKKVVLGPVIITGIFVEIILLIMGEAKMTPVLIVVFILMGLGLLIVKGSFKIIIDSEKELLILEKTSWLGKIIFKETFLLNENQFSIAEDILPKSGKYYLISIANNNTKTESNYVAEGFSKEMLEVVKNDIKKYRKA